MTALDASKAIEQLRDALEGVDLSLELPGVVEARRERSELIDQIDDYLLPRLRRLDAPLLAVLGGSTGAGKSTIANSLIGADVSPAGVLRPTTRAPVLVCHPDDLGWFEDPDGVLPGLPRSTSKSAVGSAGIRLVTSESLEPGLAILDAPDIDSVELANHDLAAQLLGAADLWLFCHDGCPICGCSAVGVSRLGTGAIGGSRRGDQSDSGKFSRRGCRPLHRDARCARP